MIELNATAKKANELLSAAGGTVYVVGGAVRDTLIGVKPKDIDLLVTGLSHAQIFKMLPHSYVTGDHFGVYRWRWGANDDEIEIAMPRTEVSTGPGHKDFRVEVDSSIPLEVDLYRRDFTVNAMAYDIAADKLIDLHGGQEDIVNRYIRAINPNSFRDDPLRILRAFVLISRYGFKLTSDTQHYMAWSAKGLSDLPAERIQEELDKIFEGQHVASAILDMRLNDVLHYVFPELDQYWDYNQNNLHHEAILGIHSLNTLLIVAGVSDDPDLRLAALLHDIGKPDSAWVDPETGFNHFYAKKFSVNEWHRAYNKLVPLSAINIPDEPGYFWLGQDHEYVGVSLAERRLRNLKYPEKRITRICKLIGGHMWPPFTSETGARRFLNKYGDLADDLLTLRYGDQGGKSIYPATPEHSLDKQRELLRIVREKGEATKTSDLAVNGHDLIEAGIKPGPNMGKILEYLTEMVIENPIMNNKIDLIVMAIGKERQLNG